MLIKLPRHKPIYSLAAALSIAFVIITTTGCSQPAKTVRSSKLPANSTTAEGDSSAVDEAVKPPANPP